MKKYIYLLVMGFVAPGIQAQVITISGFVTDGATGEALTGVSVYCKAVSKGTVTNAYGFYSIQLPAPCDLTFQYMGYEPKIENVQAKVPLELNIKLQEQKKALNEVVIKASENKIHRNESGILKLQPKDVKNVPTLGGEKDIIKIMQLMPGVKQPNEGNTGMLVRGGSTDQNLIILDEAPLYNASHLLGFFSVFNSDAIKDATMIKGGFPANYGGRLSSVLDIRMKEGNNKKVTAEGGIGILSARVTADGPLIKDKMGFMFSVRRTYLNYTYKLIGKELPYYFYDVNAKINLKLGERDRLYLSTYLGDDLLHLQNPTDSSKKDENYRIDFGSELGNRVGTLRWNHVYANNKLFSNTSLIHSRFSYGISGTVAKSTLDIQSKIEDWTIKNSFEYFKSNKHHIKFGGEYTNHFFRPNISKVRGNFNELIKSGDGLSIYTNEAALFYLSDIQLTERWGVNAGLRLSGAKTNSKVYINPEPRFLLSYKLTSEQSVKVSYSNMNQYMHLVSGSSAMPTDLWYPVSDNIKPQSSDQISATWNIDFPQHKLAFAAEVYHKWMNNLVEYKEGTVVMLNNNIEEDMIQGKGRSYGVELLLRKESGRFNGWIGYTLSWSKRQFDELNQGREFYARYDRRHDLSIVTNYEYTRRIMFSATWVFATGSRFTPVVSQYLMPKGNYMDIEVLPVYSDRNAVQLSASHRLDINVVIKSKPGKRFESEWHIGAYNVYNRTQPYRIRIEENNGRLTYKQLGMFGFIPSVAWNFKF